MYAPKMITVQMASEVSSLGYAEQLAESLDHLAAFQEQLL
ncbi:hypothetical protein PC129_g15266 [Phytophthora cactorum]|uniref:Uncharacterized protein n=1 Tax=Phytophthora cactorum TaxID=29920 RepID=A0A8T1BHQ8_9STRA|nr:hypothetical protein Pcac1_g6748 [Phytophthora cactorum]KAG2808833.1 hypothetical protein PC112_g16781 [Phytophthora cactorum]KAG2810393.1 hypothetical protein PC111_g15674 [Phytophthora cactorum]KAG2850349.1 hypothetical protein PC113_g16859 [Phytophthora cactorum]KAG2888555.1 hypothetical protein PC114_g18371 [Phytophthora cactorum]